MRPLADLERLFERMLERPTARLFRTSLRPIQVQRRIERAMEAQRHQEDGRVRVPEQLRVRLAPSDLVNLQQAADDVASRLADAALVFARSHGYVVIDRPRVELVPDAAISPGDVRVTATFGVAAQAAGDGRGGGAHGTEGPAGGPRWTGEAPAGGVGPAGDAGAAGGAGVVGDTAPGGVERSGGGPAGGVSDATMILRTPIVATSVAILRELRPDGSSREIALDGLVLDIGRADDNGLVLPGSRVSRHHARLQARHGVLVLTDLGSTNGVRVNGTPIAEIALGAGDRIEIGDHVLLVEFARTD